MSTNPLFKKLNSPNTPLTKSGIRDALSGIGGGISNKVSGAFGGIGDFFAGFFANGGFIPGGKFGVVGERGPELVAGPAQVTPMAGGVTYNINAVDVNSFQNLLARDPGYLHSLVVKARNQFQEVEDELSIFRKHCQQHKF